MSKINASKLFIGLKPSNHGFPSYDQQFAFWFLRLWTRNRQKISFRLPDGLCFCLRGSGPQWERSACWSGIPRIRTWWCHLAHWGNQAVPCRETRQFGQVHLLRYSHQWLFCHTPRHLQRVCRSLKTGQENRISILGTMWAALNFLIVQSWSRT